MRFFLGSDLRSNQNIFSITVTQSNASHTGDTTIEKNGTASLTFSPSTGYELPSTITVIGASYSWVESSGALQLYNPTQNITVVVNATLETPAKIYGVSGLYAASSALTRTDDAVGLSYLFDDNSGQMQSDFDLVFPWNEATAIEVGENKFLRLPDMWFRVGTDQNGNITDVAVSKKRGAVGDWYKVDSFCYGCYEGGTFDNVPEGTQKLYSNTDSFRIINNTSRASARAMADRNNTNGKHEYFELDLYHQTVMLFLWYIEFAEKNAKNLFGLINFEQTPYYLFGAGALGSTDVLSTPSGLVLLGEGYNDGFAMRWHYIENFIGGPMRSIEGIVGRGGISRAQYVTADPAKFTDDPTSADLNRLSYDAPSESPSYQTYTGLALAFGWDPNNPFMVMPKEAEQDGTAYNTYLCSKIDLLNDPPCWWGVGWNGTLSDGFNLASYWHGFIELSHSYSGARLLYKPQV